MAGNTVSTGLETEDARRMAALPSFDEMNRVGLVETRGNTSWIYGATLSKHLAVGGNPNGGHLNYLCVCAATATVKAGLGAASESGPGARFELFSTSMHFFKAAKLSAVEILVEEVSASRTSLVFECSISQGTAKELIARSTVVFFDTERLTGTTLPMTLGSPPDLPPSNLCVSAPKSGNVTDVLDVRSTENMMRPYGPRSLTGVRKKEAMAASLAALEGTPLMTGYVRHEGGLPLERNHLAFIADAMIPPVLNLAEFAVYWIPTTHLSVYIRATPKNSGGYLRYRFMSRCIIDGVLEIDGELWDDQNVLVAQSRQLARSIPIAKTRKETGPPTARL